jgi:hypothetical protein
MKPIHMIAASLSLLAASAAFAEQRPIGLEVAPLYAKWLSIKAQCERHGPWTNAKNTACNQWYEATDNLARHGWCFGGSAAREPWHICNADDRHAEAQAMAANADFARKETNVLRAMSPADRLLYRRWAALDRPCEDGVVNTDCRGVATIERKLKSHGWCRYSPISHADEFWHRCLPGDEY